LLETYILLSNEFTRLYLRGKASGVNAGCTGWIGETFRRTISTSADELTLGAVWNEARLAALPTRARVGRLSTVGELSRQRLESLSEVSVISQDCDDAFWHLSEAFSIPISDSNTSRGHKSSCVKAPCHVPDGENNHFNHKQTRDLD
jgi:hypothetical protein